METRRIALVLGTGILVGLLLLAALGTAAFAQGPAGQQGWSGPGGMMGGRGGMHGTRPADGPGNFGQNWGDAQNDDAQYDNWMPGRRGMRGGYGTMSPQNCPGAGWGNPGTGTPISMDETIQRAEAYLNSYATGAELEMAEVMEFEDNFYVLVEEANTGKGAFELLVDRYSGWVHPEPGPNMMWNTRYGHMAGRGGGHGGRWGTPPAGEMPISAQQAVQFAQNWVAQNLPDTTVDSEHVAEFYGYYTLHTLQNDEPAGMLSVNGYTGAVWYHTWHGDFIGMREFHNDNQD